MKGVEYIYGSLKIKETGFTQIRFPDLKAVYGPVYIQNNPNLEEVTFDQLEVSSSVYLGSNYGEDPNFEEMQVCFSKPLMSSGVYAIVSDAESKQKTIQGSFPSTSLSPAFLEIDRVSYPVNSTIKPAKPLRIRVSNRGSRDFQYLEPTGNGSCLSQINTPASEGLEPAEETEAVMEERKATELENRFTNPRFRSRTSTQPKPSASESSSSPRRNRFSYGRETTEEKTIETPSVENTPASQRRFPRSSRSFGSGNSSNLETENNTESVEETPASTRGRTTSSSRRGRFALVDTGEQDKQEIMTDKYESRRRYPASNRRGQFSEVESPAEEETNTTRYNRRGQASSRTGRFL